MNAIADHDLHISGHPRIADRHVHCATGSAVTYDEEVLFTILPESPVQHVAILHRDDRQPHSLRSHLHLHLLPVQGLRQWLSGCQPH